MPSRFAPQNVKDNFYDKFQNPKNYKTLKIKVNKTTKDLKDIFNKNLGKDKKDTEINKGTDSGSLEKSILEKIK